MSALSPEKTIAEYVLEQPGLSKVFQAFGIDFCCGGKRPLQEVCREKGLDTTLVLQALNQAAMLPENETLDWKSATLADMVDHIYTVHHQYLYDEMPRLAQMTSKVARVHGEHDPRLLELARVYDLMTAELSMHMKKEENVLFPYCRALATATTLPQFHCGGVENPIRVMGLEHEQTGEQLAAMRTLTDGYTAPDWACNTYRAMLDGLAKMEADIHQHIHEENNILFPKALKTAASLRQ